MRLLRSKKGLNPLTLQYIVLYILAALVTLVFYLVITAYAGQSVPAFAVENEHEINLDYLADALVTLPNWDGHCGCLAKSVKIKEEEKVYEGLVPSWKLDSIMNDCNAIREAASNFPMQICAAVPGVTNKFSRLTWSFAVTDLETAQTWTFGELNPNMMKSSTTRMIAIEHPDGKVHLGKIEVSTGTEQIH